MVRIRGLKGIAYDNFSYILQKSIENMGKKVDELHKSNGNLFHFVLSYR